MALPDDVLHEIFRKLDGTAATRCRQVCRRWREAVDSLSDTDWKQICSNDAIYQEYVPVRDKYGLSWKESYKALTSWSRINSYEMSSQELCDGIENFFVLPKGIVACLRNIRHKSECGFSDTIVYYDSTTFQECATKKFSKPFWTRYFFENEYLKVLLLKDNKICIVINKTQQEFNVGFYSPEEMYYYLSSPFTVIGKEVYFLNSEDKVIHVSKLIDDNETPTIKTERLEAFLENHDSYEETIVQFAIKDGNVVILSDEGNKGNIYVHENADLGWVSQFYYDEMSIFMELLDHGFNWKCPAIYNWLTNNTNLINSKSFYSHGDVYLTTRNYGKIICIFYYPSHVYCLGHLQSIFKGKPKRSIPVKSLVPNHIASKDSVSQLDIIETPTSHKIVAKVGKKVFILEFVEKSKLAPTKNSKDSVQKKKVLKAKKKSATAKCIVNATKVDKAQELNKKLSTAIKKKKNYVAKKKTVQKGKKSVQKEITDQTKSKIAKRVGSKPHKHSYATRSSTK